MKKLGFFKLSIGGAILRFYLMMAVVLIAGFSGIWLIGLLALPIFLSIMTGVSFPKFKLKTNTVSSAKSISTKPANKKELVTAA